jgi:hypothetical protein
MFDERSSRLPSPQLPEIIDPTVGFRLEHLNGEVFIQALKVYRDVVGASLSDRDISMIAVRELLDRKHQLCHDSQIAAWRLGSRLCPESKLLLVKAFERQPNQLNPCVYFAFNPNTYSGRPTPEDRELTNQFQVAADSLIKGVVPCLPLKDCAVSAPNERPFDLP